MALEKLKVRIEDLKAGMFVSELDRPWLETPFPFQGFTIQNNEDLRRLERYCKYVYIDVFKSMSVEDGREFAANLPRPERHDELVVRGRQQEPKTLAAARRVAREARGTANGWAIDATKLGKQWIDQAFDRLGVPDRPRQKNILHRLGDLAEALL